MAMFDFVPKAMKICKDCIHDKLCDMWAVESGLPFVNPNTCEHFKNKADFVEGVRCSQCKHLTIHNSPTLYAYCEKTHFRFEPFQADTRTHFCAYGERSDT